MPDSLIGHSKKNQSVVGCFIHFFSVWPWARIIYGCVNCFNGQRTFPNIHTFRRLFRFFFIQLNLPLLYIARIQKIYTHISIKQCNTQLTQSVTQNSCKWIPLTKCHRKKNTNVFIPYDYIKYQTNDDQSHTETGKFEKKKKHAIKICGKIWFNCLLSNGF